MQFIQSDLGHRRRGDVVEVTLSKWANVRLMDPSNFARYKRGESHRYHGGLFKQSPVRLAVPSDGRWHVTVDVQGLANDVKAGIRVIPKSALEPLPEVSAWTPQLQGILKNFEAAHDSDATLREWDVFISHASEDKESIVRPLASALRSHNLSVWYDEFEMRIGDSLRRKIDRGISASRFGVVVLSRAFFAKQWPQYELDGLVSMSISGKQVLLPLWHEISLDEVRSYSPSLADKVALRTADYSVDDIAREIAHVVLDHRQA